MRKGFTLIELLIVVAIIAILAAIAVPNFLNAQIRAKIARSLAEMRNMGTAIEAFRADFGLDLLDHWDDDDASERSIYFNNPALQHTIPGNTNAGRSNLYVFNILSTPVAYMATIPLDSMFPKNVNTGGLAWNPPTYLYADQDGHRGAGNDHNIGALWPGYAEQRGLLPLSQGEWVLLGAGPDSRIEVYSLKERRGIPYDPSNGLVSMGDLTVRSSGSATF